MISLISPAQAQQKLAENARTRRLELELTQTGLAKRSGVALATLRKFEQHGTISLESYLRLQLVLGGLEALVRATEPIKIEFSSIDEVLSVETKTQRKRGRRS